MTNLSLRIYNKDIEGMIEGGQVEEAVAHCQFILRSYPMHLETYRLLGKAFLEMRRYADAADIFQRVIMSVPDDFVSHVGMSIIKDDEGKLDEAIWHMERSFQVQPSNPAIQDELRKLYGRRDGVEPPKIRLTRDALANMYIQGALYGQAISEIKTILSEDPNRPDLLVMLARVYFKEGRKTQAIETSTTLLKKYPYCFDALRILLEVIPDVDQKEILKSYRQRVNSLDPYIDFVQGSTFAPETVPDGSVVLEQLDYALMAKSETNQPAWASSLGIKLEDNIKEEPAKPAWIPADEQLKKSEEESKPTPESNQEPQAEPEIETQSEPLKAEMPDWMKSTGWEPADISTGKTTGPEKPVENQSQAVEEEILNAEIPDWLNNMAPAAHIHEANAENTAEDYKSDLEINEVSEEISKEEVTGEETVEGSASTEPVEGDIPTWLIELRKQRLEAEEEPDKEITEIYAENSSIEKEKSQIQDEEPEQLIRKTDEFSDWLTVNQIKKEDSENPIDETEELPDWLKKMSSVGDEEKVVVPVQEEEINSTSAMEENIPELIGEESNVGEAPLAADSVEEEKATTAESAPVSDEASKSDQEEAMVWLEGMAATLGVRTEELLSNPEDWPEGQPEWVKKTIEKGTSELKEPPILMEDLEPSGIAKEVTKILVEPEEIVVLPEEQDLITHAEVIDSGQELIIEDIYVEKDDLATVEINSEENQDGTLIESLIEIGDQSNEQTADLIPEQSSEEVSEEAIDEVHELIPDIFAEETQEDVPEDSVAPMADVIPDELFEAVQEASLSETNEGIEKDLSVEGQETTLSMDSDSSELVSADEIKENSVEKSATGEEELPDWLNMTRNQEFKSEQTPIQTEAVAEEIEPLPDWLKSLDEQSLQVEWPPESTSLPDWFTKEEKSSLPIPKLVEEKGENRDQEKLVDAVSKNEYPPFLDSIASQEEAKPDVDNRWIPMEDAMRKPDSTIESNLMVDDDKKVDEQLTATDEIQATDGQGDNQNQPENEMIDLKESIKRFEGMVKRGGDQEQLITEIKILINRFPEVSDLWRILGDAYMRTNHLHDAIEAYTKAEELLH